METLYSDEVGIEPVNVPRGWFLCVQNCPDMSSDINPFVAVKQASTIILRNFSSNVAIKIDELYLAKVNEILYKKHHSENNGDECNTTMNQELSIKTSLIHLTKLMCQELRRYKNFEEKENEKKKWKRPK